VNTGIWHVPAPHFPAINFPASKGGQENEWQVPGLPIRAAKNLFSSSLRWMAGLCLNFPRANPRESQTKLIYGPR
jgi:hypothetical protein